MNTADSLTFESDCRDKCLPKSFSAANNHQVDTSLQGAEIQDSPRGGSVNSSSSSLSPVRVDTSIPQTTAPSSAQFTTSCAAPIAGHQLLIDPITGQHYLLPSNPQAHPQVIYQPVYYAPAPPQPVFYQSFTPSAQGALLMPSANGQHGINSYVHPTTLNQRVPVNPSIVSSKPNSVGSSSPTTVDSRAGRLKILNEDRQFHRICGENEIRSPPMSPSYREGSMQLSKSIKSPQQQSYREIRRPSPLLNICANEDADQIPLKDQRTPLYGTSPAWWGDDKLETENFAEVSSGNQKPTSEQSAAVQKKKPIRMDIDFSKPFEEVEREKEEKTKVVLRAPPTSFTVSFDSENNVSSKEKMSLQDAAKKSNSRRLLRRSAPAAAGMTKSPVEIKSNRILAETTDPKQYLFKKMLMGDAASGEGFTGAPEFVASVGGPQKRDVDVISEAGTYVVDEKDRLLDLMNSSQCLEDSDDDSDSSESSTASTSSASDQTPPSYAPVHFIENKAGTSSSSNAEKKADGMRLLTHGNKGRRETQKLYDANLRKNLSAAEKKVSVTCSATATVSRACILNAPLDRSTKLTGSNKLSHTNAGPNSKRNDFGLPSSPRRWGIASSNSSNDNVTKTRSARSDPPIVKNEVGPIRRIDGGRFSMRTASSGRTANPVSSCAQKPFRNAKPPFRVGPFAGNLIENKGTTVHKESNEMTAWLRRKDYNPMKSAAEARKLQQLKSRLQAMTSESQAAHTLSDQFTSNRSISFHQGSASTSAKITLSANLGKSRHNKSQDDLCEENACGSRAVLATYSKGVTENLNRLKLEASGVQKAVEQLASKCYRSIDLIRSAHQGRLPDSVENLLDQATQPALKTNSVAEQVTRLSAAFDAIQKYLEVYSCASPSPSSTNSGRASPNQQTDSGTNEGSEI